MALPKVLLLLALFPLCLCQEGDLAFKIVAKPKNCRLSGDGHDTVAEELEGTENVLHEGGGMLIFAAAALMVALLIGNILHHCEVGRDVQISRYFENLKGKVLTFQ